MDSAPFTPSASAWHPATACDTRGVQCTEGHVEAPTHGTIRHPRRDRLPHRAVGVLQQYHHPLQQAHLDRVQVPVSGHARAHTHALRLRVLHDGKGLGLGRDTAAGAQTVADADPARGPVLCRVARAGQRRVPLHLGRLRADAQGLDAGGGAVVLLRLR
eukprot:scaffold129087_cov66-Phaeocystis_antarctica.AAC.6